MFSSVLIYWVPRLPYWILSFANNTFRLSHRREFDLIGQVNFRQSNLIIKAPLTISRLSWQKELKMEPSELAEGKNKCVNMNIVLLGNSSTSCM